MHEKQSYLQALLVMAYNVGRAHGETNVMSIESGRERVSKMLPKLVEHIDPGDLVLPAIWNSRP